MSSSSKNSLTEKHKELPYDDAETEYRSVVGEDDKEFDDHESFREYEYDSATKPHRTPLYRRKKFIWGCVIATIIFLAIFVPLLILVIIPKIAQSLLDSSDMVIQQLNMTNPGETALSVSVAADVQGIPKIFSADLAFTEELKIFWHNKQIGAMNLTPVKISGGKGQIQQSTGFTIADKEAFADFVKEMLSADGFEWTLKSTATLKALGQTIENLTVDKVLKMNGLSNFSNLKILKFDLPGDAPNGAGALISISAAIDNPSPIGMNLGTLTLDMNFETAYLGQVVAKNVVLVPGKPMILNLEGTLLKQTDPIHLQELSTLFSNFLGNVVTKASAQGVSVFPDGINAVSWLTSAIVTTKLIVPLVSPEPLNVIQDLKIKDMGLYVRPENPWAPTTYSNEVSAMFKLPFNISLNITELANATFTIVYKGIPLADLTAAVWNQTMSDMANNKIVFTLPSSPLSVKLDAHGAFQDFLTEVLQSTDSGFDIKGSADAVAITPMGIVRLKVPFASTVALKGIGFASIPPTITNVTVVGGTTEYVTLSANVAIDNPSIFAVDAGPVNLKISGTTGGVFGLMGDVIIPNLKFAPGVTHLMAEVRFRPLEAKFRDSFFSGFVGGSTFDVEITGDEDSTTIESMIPVVKVVKLKSKVPGIIPAPRLIVSGNGTPGVGSVLGNRQIPLAVNVMNPLLTSFAINDIDADVIWRGNYFGTIKSQSSFLIPVGQTMPSPPLIVQVPTDFQFGLFMVTSFLPANPGIITGAIVDFDMNSFIGVSVGGVSGVGYKSTISYNQTAVPAFLKLDLGFASGLRKRANEVLAYPEPSLEDSSAYLGWLKDALFANYPEEAKLFKTLQLDSK
ncbi:hypothetical protein BG004_004799 [Podila humilis]|nr:hypothetical protein BG004_004799 [Podila humilis]